MKGHLCIAYLIILKVNSDVSTSGMPEIISLREF